MPVMQVAVGIVELVQMFDQQITPMTTIGAQTDQGLHLVNRHLIGLVTFEFAFVLDALAHFVEGRDVSDFIGWIHK